MKGLAAQTKKSRQGGRRGRVLRHRGRQRRWRGREVNSQTDFVAKNEVFQDFVKTLA